MLRTYSLAPDTVRRVLRRTFWRFQGFSALSFLGFGLYLAILAQPVDWQMAGPMVGIIALVYFLIIFYNFRQQLRFLYSVRYEIDDSSITYRQLKQPPLHISRAIITRAQERKDGISIETSDSRIKLFVPCGLAREGDADFYTTLHAWVTVQPEALSPSGAEIWVWIAALASSFLILVLANSLWISLALTLFFIIFGLYVDRRLKRSPNLLPSTIRTYNMAIGFLVFVILMKSCLLGYSALALASR
jgi:hypothetical protein